MVVPPLLLLPLTRVVEYWVMSAHGTVGNQVVVADFRRDSSNPGKPTCRCLRKIVVVTCAWLCPLILGALTAPTESPPLPPSSNVASDFGTGMRRLKRCSGHSRRTAIAPAPGIG
jgi:hypothetical protein